MTPRFTNTRQCITCGVNIIDAHVLSTGDIECVECFRKRSPEERARIEESLTSCVTCGVVTYGLPRFPGGVQKAGEGDMVECIIEEVVHFCPL
jgi:NMD protein affecting ribosome stability and mRNA decay